MLESHGDMPPSSRRSSDPRADVVAEGFEVLCTGDGCAGAAMLAHDGTIRVVYGWDADASVRAARVRAGLAAAQALREARRCEHALTVASG